MRWVMGMRGLKTKLQQDPQAKTAATAAVE
jgi:hypothetical protein